MVAHVQSHFQSIDATQLYQIRLEGTGPDLVLIAVPGSDAGSVASQRGARILDDELDGEVTWEDAEWM